MTLKIGGIACSAILAVALAIAWSGTAFATDFNQASQFTFLRAIELPEGRVLPAGTYWFVLAEPNTALVEASAQASAVMACRTGQEVLGAWGAPVMYVLARGSVGSQTAAPFSDYVPLVMNTRAMETPLHKDVRLGADLAVAAGLTGSGTYAPDEDGGGHADVLSYSRTGNAFAGISLKDSTLRPDDAGNREFYGPNITAAEIAGETAAESPLAGQALLALLDR